MNKISTDSIADHSRQRQPNLTTNGIVFSDTDDNNATFIVTDPDSDIETDAAPDAPRPRGTHIPDPSKPNKAHEETPFSEEIPKKKSFFKGNANGRKIPGGFFKKSMPHCGTNSVVLNISNSHGVHVGPTTNIIYGQKKDKMYEDVSPPKYYEILMSSTKTVNDDHLDCVAANIGENWDKLGKQLGLSDGAIYRAKDNNRGNHHEKVYQLLLEWKQSTGGPNQAPLLSRLSLELWHLREKDALDGLVKLENDPRVNN